VFSLFFLCPSNQGSNEILTIFISVRNFSTGTTTSFRRMERWTVADHAWIGLERIRRPLGKPACTPRVRATLFFMECSECIRLTAEFDRKERAYATALGMLTASAHMRAPMNTTRSGLSPMKPASIPK
jgi:hypothetical protein